MSKKIQKIQRESAGNNSTADSENGKEEKKQISPSKHWCVTWNNYPKDWFEKFMIHRSEISGYIFGEEVGECGTPHIQGYIRFKWKKRPLSLYKFGHWAVCKDSKNKYKNAIEYCRKDGNYKQENVWKKPKVLSYEQLYVWQKEIVDIIRSEPDDRTIHWYWETTGNVGKSALCKYICMNHEAIICSGRAADMKFLVANWLKTKGTAPEIIIFDVPRSSLEYLSYSGIEEIKNGLFASTKYECEMVCMNSPHIIIFANEPPSEDKEEIMSKDRWRVREVISTVRPVAEKKFFDCG